MNTNANLQNEVGSRDGVTRRLAWLTAAHFIGFVLSFVTPLLIVRTLNQSDFGVYKQIFQILATALGMLNLQMASSAYYFMGREPQKKLQIAVNVVLFYLIMGSVLALVFIVYPGWVRHVFHSSGLISYIPLVGVAILLWLVSTNLEVIPLALGDVRVSAAFIVSAQLTKAILMITAALIFRSVFAIIIAAIIQGLGQTIFMIFYLKRRLGSLRQPIDWALFKRQLANALPFGAGGIAQSFQGDLHNYLVSYYFPPALFAVYSVGCFQLPFLSQLQISFANAMIPEIAQLEAAGDYRGIIQKWFNAICKIALLFAPCFALMYVLRYELITLLFTENYAASVPIFSVYLFNVLLMIALSGALVRAFADFRFYRFKLHLALLPVTWLSVSYGIHKGGLVGAITAVVGIQLLDIIITLSLVGRRVGLKLQDLKALEPIIRTALAAAAAAMAALMAKLALGQRPVIARLALCSIIFGIVYLAAIFVLGVLSDQEKSELRSELQRWKARLGFARFGWSSSTGA